MNIYVEIFDIYKFLSFLGFSDYDDVEEKPSTNVPQLLSTSLAIEATVGEPVTFPCDIDDLGNICFYHTEISEKEI